MKTKFSQATTDDLFVRADSLERGVALIYIYNRVTHCWSDFFTQWHLSSLYRTLGTL